MQGTKNMHTIQARDTAYANNSGNNVCRKHHARAHPMLITPAKGHCARGTAYANNTENNICTKHHARGTADAHNTR
eukprot:scaffold1924_cov20-Tisochrysis_lutea.AAC.1